MSTRTPSTHAATEPTSRAALLLILTAGALLAGLAGAGPAAAVDDPTRPDARVTHGPSCRPGGIVVEVVAGSEPYAVTLATTRTPAGEDFAVVRPGETVVLSTGDVAWGETIDGYLEYTALDGSQQRHVDDLDGYTFTRPAKEDCAAIIVPAAPATVPLAPPGPEFATPGTPAESGAVDAAPGDGALPAGGDGGGSGTGAVPPVEAGRPGPSRSFGDGGAPVQAVAVAPAAARRDASVASLFVAAVALAAAVAGLVTVAGRRGSGSSATKRNA